MAWRRTGMGGNLLRHCRVEFNLLQYCECENLLKITVKFYTRDLNAFFFWFFLFLTVLFLART